MHDIRLARETDARALLDIYAPYVRETPITFEYEVPSVEEFAARIRRTLARYPYLIYERDGVPVGYSYAGPKGERAAYQWSAELSVYLSPACRRQGVGRALYQRLFSLLEIQGVHTLYACITLPGEASVGLHTALGFSSCGLFRSTGSKFGQWYDTCWMEKPLRPYEENPRPFTPFHALPAQTVRTVLAGPAALN